MSIKETTDDKKSAKEPVVSLKNYWHFADSPSDKSYLMGSKCRVCGSVVFPKRPICPVCVKENTMEDIPLGTRGTIVEFCVSKVAATGFFAPCIHSWIRLKDGPKVFSTITGTEVSEEAVKVGMEVELFADKVKVDEKGNDVIGYTFRPVKI